MWTRLGYFSRETLVSLRRNLLMTIAGILTVAVSLALFGGIMVLSKWVDHGTEQIKGGVRAEIFMKVERHEPPDRRSEVDARRPTHRSARSGSSTSRRRTRSSRSIFKNDPNLVQNVTADSLPTSFRVVPKKAEFTSAIRRATRHTKASTRSSIPVRRCVTCSTRPTSSSTSSSACPWCCWRRRCS